MRQTPQPHQHTGPGDGGRLELGEARQTLNIPTTTLKDTEYITQRLHVDTDETLEILAVGVQNDENSAPAGLTLDVDDETHAVTLVSENAKKASGSPLADVSGSVDIVIAVSNDTGGEVSASGFIDYRYA